MIGINPVFIRRPLPFSMSSRRSGERSWVEDCSSKSLWLPIWSHYTGANKLLESL